MQDSDPDPLLSLERFGYRIFEVILKMIYLKKNIHKTMVILKMIYLKKNFHKTMVILKLIHLKKTSIKLWLF